MRMSRVALLAAILILSAVHGFCENMTMARYDPEQSSYTSEKLKLPLVLSWEFVGSKFDNNPAAPIVVDGTVYFTCGDRVYAVDLITGSLKWKYPSDQGLGGSVKGTPAYHDGSIYFGAGDENLYCLDAQTGAFRWAYRVRGAIRCPPVVVDDMIYIGADDESLYAIEANTGERRWVFTARDDIAVGAALGSGMAIVSSMDGNMYGVVAATGKLRWMFRLPVAPTTSSPIITDKIAVMAVGSKVYGLTARSGQQRWQVSLGAEVAATPAAQGSDVYIPCRDKKIYAFLTNGRQPIAKWEAADLGAIPMSSPVVAGDLVWATGSRGVVAAFSAVDGTLKWRYSMAPSSVTSPGSQYCDAASPPTIAEGALLVLTDDGVLHCFTPQAPDNTPPQVFATTPANGMLMSPAPPIKISGLLYDIGSGVDFSTATILLDGQPVNAKIDVPSATVTFQTEMAGDGKQGTVLKPDGLHNIVVSAKDYAGNTLTKEWYIITDSSLPPPRRSAPPAEEGKKTKAPRTKSTGQPTPSGMPNQPPMPTPSGMDMPPPPPPPPPPSPGAGAPSAPPGPR